MQPSSGRVTWRVFQVEQELDEPDETLGRRAAERAGLDPEAVRGMRVARKALDARRRGATRRLRFVCNVDLIVDAGVGGRTLESERKAGRVRLAPEVGRLQLEQRSRQWDGDPSDPVVVVGTGPAGIFAALALATNGVRVHVLERGPALRERGRSLAGFHRSREPDPERNLLFGEGGAGTYSDGKIYTRVDDPLEVPLLEVLVACGAPPEILYDSLAHIGTDRLHRVLPRLRERAEALGVRFSFDTRFEGLVQQRGPAGERRVRALRTSSGELGCSALVLAVGHSARDTWTLLAEQGVEFAAKPFQLGLRIEHPQELIDQGRYGGPHAQLGAASYNLVNKGRPGRPGAHSFCMCPGGRIVAAVNEPGLLCTNGMSNSKHSSSWATAALVTTFGPESFGPGAFAGVAFQRELERRFFEAGGSDYTAPAQSAADFLAGRLSGNLRHTTYPFGTRPARLDQLLGTAGTGALAAALESFERRLPGFAGPQGVFVGLESRSSGPVRILRERPSFRATGFANLYPVGEGAGYAGGIMSAALDGANAALVLAREGPIPEGSSARAEIAPGTKGPA